MYKVLELRKGLKPSMDSPTYIFRDVQLMQEDAGGSNQSSGMAGSIAFVSKDELLKLEELQRSHYLPVRTNPDYDIYTLKEFLCVDAFKDEAAFMLCPNDPVMMPEMFAQGALLLMGPSFNPPPYRTGVLLDMHLADQYVRWDLAAIEAGLFNVDYRPDTIGPDIPATKLRWAVLLDQIYTRLGGR